MNETLTLILCLVIPFIGTTLGSLTVFFVKDKLNNRVQKSLIGFAAGVMVAASIWSLLNPSIEQSSSMGKLSFLPAAIGFFAGILFLLLLDSLIPHMHPNTNQAEGLNTNKMKRTTMMVLAVTLHNIPEGMAVGVVASAAFFGSKELAISSAFVLAIGMAIQNFPEGSVVSIPLKIEGESKKKAFLLGSLSGIVEPLAAIITLLITTLITSILPYILSFAAGVMIYVVVEELIPETQEGEHTNLSTLFFGIGFVIMMILDIVFG